MNAPRDWRHLSLQPGQRSLVEASAGAGKTWTIGVLYLRLLLEQRLSPRQVVVATYTNAAAAELKERLRARLEDTLAQAAGQLLPPHEDSRSDLSWLHARWRDDTGTRHGDALHLAIALGELDIAPIGTLHSLCLRILGEHPFAAGAGFRLPALVDASSLQQDVATDLWRVLVADADTLDADGLALQHAAEPIRDGLNARSLASALNTLLQPGVVVPAPANVPSPWQTEWAAPLRALAGEESLWKKGSRLIRLLQQLAGLIESQGRSSAFTNDDLKALARNATARTGVAKAMQERHDVVEALDFAAGFGERLSAWLLAQRLHFLARIQAWARQQLEQRLAAAAQLGFDDLLTTVQAALRADAAGTRALADTLCAAWPVALIDEFQDTDPVQYGILDGIYRDADGEPRGHLLMIGDPKQAIYRFRGGDIHTYQRAREAVPPQQRLGLNVNHRSSRAYVQAINAFYATVGTRLGAAESDTPIHYVDVSASQRLDATPLLHDGHPAPALSLHAYVQEADLEEADPEAASGGKPKPPSAAELEPAALRSCAGQIAALLAPGSGQRIGARPLQASDICVLVPRNAHARQMVEHLRRHGIACVNRGRGSVFHSAIARDLLLVLDAVLHCDQPRRIRAALASNLFGMGYHALRQLQQADRQAQWQSLAGLFHQWHHDWKHKGVLAVVSALLQRMARRQLATREGERLLTDLRHLGELLQEYDDTADGMPSVLAWLRKQIDGQDSDEDAAEARALRLESDAQCAQVMTLHASKGLEFPLVFLPLMWQHTGNTPALGLLADADGRRRLVLDAAGIGQVQREEQDERFRVLYVALTRARHACHVWLPPEMNSRKDGATAAPLSLLTPRLQETAQALSASGVIQLNPRWPAALAPSAAATVVTPPERHARALPPERNGPLPSRHSFSTLGRAARAYLADPGAPANDEAGNDGNELAEVPALPRQPHPELMTLLRVAGPDFGNAVHAIFEHHQIGVPLTEQRELLRTQLAENAVHDPELDDELLASRLATRLQQVLDTDLDGKGLRLSALPANAQRHEMEFNYALDHASLTALAEACASAGWPQLVPASLPRLSGLMNGKIDLLFQHAGRVHVLDWKSNHLGSREDAFLEDYAAPALEAKMDAAGYRFQALLYTVALERYLQARLGAGYRRAQHLGDCWYLFVRATGLQLADGSACGIWHHRFSDALLDAAQQALSTSSANTARSQHANQAQAAAEYRA